MSDFSTLSVRRRAEIERYIDRLTDSQVDKLAAMTPQDAADAILPEAEGLGFFWWIIEAAYAVKVAKDAKAKKAKANKALAEVKAKAASEIKKQKEKLTAIKSELDLLDKLKAEQGVVGAAARNPIPFLIGAFAVLAGLVYLYKRRKKA